MLTKPTYKARNARYEIDRCEPQNRAIETGKILFHALTKGHYPGTPVPENILPGLNSIGFWNAGKHHRIKGEDPHRNEGWKSPSLRPAQWLLRPTKKNAVAGRTFHHHAPMAAS